MRKRECVNEAQSCTHARLAENSYEEAAVAPNGTSTSSACRLPLPPALRMRQRQPAAPTETGQVERKNKIIP